MNRPGETRSDKLERFGRWVKETCDMAGAEPHTGYLVAGVLLQNLAAEWAKQDTAKQATP